MRLDYTNLYKTLSEVNRRRILAVLDGNECSVQDIQDVLSLGQSSISAHLAQLKVSGLVDFRRLGRFIMYRLALGFDDEVDQFLSSILSSLNKEDWYLKDSQRLKKLLDQKKAISLSFYEGVETQNKRSPGQTDHSLAIALLRVIRGKTIIDVGCGAGKLAYEFARLDNKVIGIDTDKKQIEIAKKWVSDKPNSNNVKFIVGSGQDTKQAPTSADIVIYSHSLHHVDEPEAAIKESARILKNNGMLIILDLKKHEEHWIKKIYGDVHLGFDPEELTQVVSKAGFSSISTDIDLSDDDFPQFESLILTAIKHKSSK